MFDPVLKPEHYNQGEIEVIDFMLSQYGVEKTKIYCVLNAAKYVARAFYKNGDEDIRKAIWYLRFAIGEDPRKDRT